MIGHSENPNINFIIPHMAFCSPAQADKILSKHPNVYMTISKTGKAKAGDHGNTVPSSNESCIFNNQGALKNEWR